MQGWVIVTGPIGEDVRPCLWGFGARAAYTGEVDRVRLGRALGYGTRHAAKTVAAIAEAASAPATDAKAARPSKPLPLPAILPVAEQDSPAAHRGASITPRHLSHGVTHFKRSFWGPLATFSGALWLRVTGLFFALIAFATGGGAWRLRAGFFPRSAAAEVYRFWVFAAFTALFGYFALSSFVRATMRERRAAARKR